MRKVLRIKDTRYKYKGKRKKEKGKRKKEKVETRFIASK